MYPTATVRTTEAPPPKIRAKNGCLGSPAWVFILRVVMTWTALMKSSLPSRSSVDTFQSGTGAGYGAGCA